MKKLLTVFLLIISFDLIAQDNGIYQIAFTRFISTSDAYKSKSCYRTNDFVIMREIVPFDKLSFLFQKHIPSLKESENDLPNDSTFLSEGMLIGKKRSRMKVFFTEKKGGIFFAEVTCTSTKKTTPYSSLSPFGTSAVFMFSVTSSGEVELIDVSEISNL